MDLHLIESKLGKDEVWGKSAENYVPQLGFEREFEIILFLLFNSLNRGLFSGLQALKANVSGQFFFLNYNDIPN